MMKVRSVLDIMNRLMMSPTRLQWTPSGLIMMKVRSDILKRLLAGSDLAESDLVRSSKSSQCLVYLVSL